MRKVIISLLIIGSFLTLNAQESQLLETFMLEKSLENSFSLRSNENRQNSVTVIQIGDNNLSQIEGNNIEVLQQGYQQEFIYVTDRKVEEGQMEIEMKGGNNALSIYGSNSISENMKVKMNTHLETLIIENF